MPKFMKVKKQIPYIPKEEAFGMLILCEILFKSKSENND